NLSFSCTILEPPALRLNHSCCRLRLGPDFCPLEDRAVPDSTLSLYPRPLSGASKFCRGGGKKPVDVACEPRQYWRKRLNALPVLDLADRIDGDTKLWTTDTCAFRVDKLARQTIRACKSCPKWPPHI